MYAGQASKDLIRQPRPLTPPVVKLEEKYMLEYGFPSTHAMAALNISLTLTYFAFVGTYTASEHFEWRMCVAVVATCACSLVCLSRLYLGMHSWLDVIGGLLYSLLISLLFISLMQSLDQLLRSSALNGALIVAAMLLMCAAYPCREAKWSPARADTFLIMGVGVGVTLGVTLRYAVARIEHMGEIRWDQDRRGDDSMGLWKLIALRSLVGYGVILGVRFVSKKIVYAMVRYLYADKTKNKEEVNAAEIIRTRFALEIVYYVFCYANVGFHCLVTAFYAFELLDIV